MGLDKFTDSKVGQYLKLETKMATEKMEFRFDKPREDLVNTAVKFLINPDIRQKPIGAKQEFLKNKGLTPEEIKLAFDRSSSAQYENSVSHTVLQLPVPLQSVGPVSLFQKIREIVSTVAAFGAVAYALYYFYQKYIVPYFFGRPKRKTVEESIKELKDSVRESIKSVKDEIIIVQNEVERVARNHVEHRVEKLVDDVKTDLATVKGLLLNRHQFPSVNLSTTSIPAWQLTSAKDKDEEASGSASEADIVNNTNSNGGSQGSDSSLEMIKEVEN